jgi:hypothetical protein
MKTHAKAIAIVTLMVVQANAQSLLTEPPLQPAQARAIRAAENAQGLRDSVIGGLRHSITDLWSSDHQANVETAVALGNRAAELFSLYESFMASVRSLLVASGDTKAVAELDAIATLVPNHVKNSDGTVTLITPVNN